MVSNILKAVSRDIVEKLVKEYQPQKVLLFGSLARGDHDDESDIDLLIIKETDDRLIDRWVTVRKILSDPDRSVGLEPIVLTPKEIAARLERGDQFIEEILTTGITLYAA